MIFLKAEGVVGGEGAASCYGVAQRTISSLEETDRVAALTRNRGLTDQYLHGQVQATNDADGIKWKADINDTKGRNREKPLSLGPFLRPGSGPAPTNGKHIAHRHPIAQAEGFSLTQEWTAMAN